MLKNFIGEKKWKDNYEIIEEIFKYQNLRMPRINMSDKSDSFNYNIAEYMFYYGSYKTLKLTKQLR